MVPLILGNPPIVNYSICTREGFVLILALGTHLRADFKSFPEIRANIMRFRV